MPPIGTSIGLGKMGFKLNPAQERAVEARAAAKKKIGDLSFKPSDAQKKAILAREMKKASAPAPNDEYGMFSTPELKQRLSELEKEVKGAYKSDHDMNIKYQEMKAALAKREKKSEAPKPATKAKEKGANVLFEEFFDRITKLSAIEDDLTDVSNADEWLQTIKDKGEYHDYEGKAIDEYGGDDVIAKKAYNYLLKNGISKKRIIQTFKDAREDGYTIFDEMIGE